MGLMGWATRRLLRVILERGRGEGRQWQEVIVAPGPPTGTPWARGQIDETAHPGQGVAVGPGGLDGEDGRLAVPRCIAGAAKYRPAAMDRRKKELGSPTQYLRAEGASAKLASPRVGGMWVYHYTTYRTQAGVTLGYGLAPGFCIVRCFGRVDR
ncbi:hypothetical protein GQ53DRAFT_760000 [Thozetella sp. PMI_491]|nr:hypothetical protein GQ53DRAFT_760000 [Thozetella sp. PMI_491]